MHHLYPKVKGDPLCPLGFHPQVRWPTRCKRCFRDYKEHGGGGAKKPDDFTASTPSLSTWSSPASRNRDEENGVAGEKTGRGWASSTNLSGNDTKKDAFSTGFSRTSSSWTSTPDLGANDSESTTAVTVSLKLPKRRATGPLPTLDTGQNNISNITDTVTLRRPSPSPPPTPANLIITKNDSLAERVRKMNLLKAQNSFEKESSIEKERERRSMSRSKEEEKPPRPKEDRSSVIKEDVNFMMQVKSSRNSLTKPPKRGGPSRDKEETSDDDAASTTTVTTETTLVDANVKEYQDQIDSLKHEVDTLKRRCERVEKEKSDILLRRLANIDTANKYTTGRSSEVLKLQQKVNELTSQNEDLKDEKKHLTLRVKEVESELEARPSAEAQARQIEQLRAKLLAAETLCEELMDENEDMKKELRDLEEEIEEMQDNFREDQADEYSSLRRELEQTIKNCRVLSFKLKKTERKAEQLEQEKNDQEKKLLELVGGQEGMQRENRIKELEQEVSRANEVSLRLQRELADANAKLTAATGAPPANLKKPLLGDGQKVSRSSLTRGGSQEDPAQLLRDLQDSLEREADLREQLRNAEEEASRYRQRFGGRRIPLAPQVTSSIHPDLIPHQNSVTKNVDELNEQNSMKRLLEMQLSLEKSLSSLDVSHISIGVNQVAQVPQDITQFYSEGCQTDVVMVHDVSTETRKITLDSSVQCNQDTLEMYTQTEAVFMKTKNVQTDFVNVNAFTQTDKLKLRNAAVQTVAKLYSDKCEQAARIEIQKVDSSTETEVTLVYNKGTITENVDVYDLKDLPSTHDINNGFKEFSDLLPCPTEKSDSPPLTPEKATADSSSGFSFPFVSLFSPFAVRLPTIGRKLSPTPPTNRLAIEAPNEKDEGISDEEDPAELRLLLELNEQEAAVLRRKVEELEQDRDSLKTQVKELTDKIASTTTKTTTNSTISLRRNSQTKTNNLADEKVKVLEDEIAELRKKLIEKERDCERLHAELSLAQKKPKGSLIKSKSLDGDQQNVDLKRQLQVIEQEASVLRAKTQSLEADNEKLQAENKRLLLLRNTKTLKSDRSIEQNASKITQLETELKDAMAKIKELESKEDKTEKKVRFGGEVGKKDADAVKVKQDELDKLKLNFNKLEKENAKLQATLKELKEEAIKSFKPRTPKKLTDLTTKLQMKKMVEDLENEIGEMYVVMKNAGLSTKELNVKAQLEKDIEEAKSKLNRNESEFSNEKNRLQTEVGKLKDLNTKMETEKSNLVDKCKKLEDKCKKLETDLSNAVNENKTLKEEKKSLESQITKLNAEMKTTSTKQTSTTSDLTKKIDELKKDIEAKDKEVEKLKKQVENVSKLEQDKNKLLKEVGDKTKKIGELEKKLKDSEDKYKRAEKQLTTRKERVSKLEKELSEEKEQASALASSQRRMSVEFVSEKDEMLAKLIKTESKLITLEGDMREMKTEYEDKITSLESTIAAKDVHIKQLEDALRETSNQKYDEAVSSVEMAQMRDKLDTVNRELQDKEDELATAKQDLKQTEKELSALQTEISQIKSNTSKLENEKKDLENKLQTEKKESGYWESKASELETDLQAERKKLERMRSAHDKDTKNKEAELATLKGKLKVLEQSSGAGAKRIADLKQEYEENVKKLEHSLAVEKAEYDELTGKYEMLEEEHVVTKARLTVEKEQAQGELNHVQKQLNTTLEELKALQGNYDTQSSAWTKEKSELQTEISSLQERLCGGGWEVEKARLTAKLDQRERELRDAEDQRDVIEHHHEQAKKDLEEAKQKLEDYERVSKIQRNLTAENVELERELAALNNRLEQAEKARKTEITDTKMRYEGQMNTMRDELKSLHNQVSRFKRERDNYKQMLEAAQKAMAEIKNGDKNARTHRMSISSTDEEEYRSKVAALEQQVACLEDELCEARLLSSKLNTELVSEKSAAEVRLAEMQSRLNEYEEERLLSSGRARVAGLATRMELAWHKERDEQQRLLQETSTLARDLRQTLFEVEREREKERLDMKRRIDQLKRTTEEETEEAKKKVSELQCDLLELRDAHAKLRTANEKLRRDKERHDRDRDQNKLLVGSLKRAQQEDDRIITQLLETIDDLMKQSPELFRSGPPVKPEKSLMTPTPPRRNRSSKSRSRSATPESAEAAGIEAANTASRLRRLTDELRASRIAERQRRQQATARRAMSTEPRDTLTVTPVSTRTPSRAPSLKKRSISLEQTTKDQSQIWKTVDDSSVSSMQSLDGDNDMRLFTMQNRDSSLDSRLSGGSTQSDVLPSEKKKKKSIFGKFKKLTKSRSIDDQPDPEVVEFRPIGTVSHVSQGSDSDMSAAGSKRDLRGRLSDMFSRKGQMSRGNSKEKSPERPASAAANISSSVANNRPILRNASSTTLQRASPAKPNEVPSSRASSATPAAKRKGK
ncbi:CAP-Gly domain-containing linker protein 1 isoform X3 [Pectinophora gossypiella]|uniref:CAP-Gly domain-containing linker protein 1 isoform X3 n=1 Tax=Pectinophora gossypiella TaxID=13191 RepID=UPI00214E2CF5|nr:CAP-Gly domain-containing linker protein 1 isoform X3 [Pectinophora gossypiella]